MYSCHIEYDYMGKGDCIDLSTLDDTYYIYPKIKDWSATKISLAVEEMYGLASGVMKTITDAAANARRL
jgi:F420-0:gamma-glutamyl ligase